MSVLLWDIPSPLEPCSTLALGSITKRPAQFLCLPFSPAQMMPKSRMGLYILGNFKARPLWRVIMHRNFKVRYWKGIVFLINPIPINSSFLAQPQFPHCSISWHTWGRERDTFGHGSCPSQNQRWRSLPSGVSQYIRINPNNPSIYLKPVQI